MNLTELSEAWNTLRNDTLGRGTTPLVPQPLADRIGNTYERWRAWLAKASPLDDVMADATASGWLSDYRALYAQASATGVKMTPPLQTTLVETATKFSSELVQTFVIVGAAISLPLLYLLMRGGRR